MRALRLWLVRLLLPDNVAVFGAGTWRIGETIQLEKGQVISGVGTKTKQKPGAPNGA